MTRGDKEIFIKSIIEVATKCDCICHKKGFDISHIQPCCSKTYQKFD